MKNKRKVLAPTIAGLATCSMVLPLALSATSCSCSKFASTSVLDGDYIPDYEPYDAGTSTWKDPETGLDYEVPNFVNIPQGEDLMLKAYINDKKMPAKEHKWMASGAAYYLTYAADFVNNYLGYEAIKINKYNADLKNFKVEDSRTGRVSYDISQDIDVTLDVQPGNIPFPSNLKLDSIAGNIRLAWNHKVKNMPLGIFDLGTDNWNITGREQKRAEPIFGDKPFEDMTIWFVAPDMSEVPVGDKTWALDLDFLIDADIDVNGDKLIDIDHEYNFTFDKYAAWGIEQLIQAISEKGQVPAKLMAISYVVERFIPLCAGWMSYYLSQCHHMDHIMSRDVTLPQEYWSYLGWQTKTDNNLQPHIKEAAIPAEKDTLNNDLSLEHWEGPAKPISEYNTTAFTKFGKPAHIVYELTEGGYSNNDVLVACVGVNSADGRFSLLQILKNILKGQLPIQIVGDIHTDYEVDPFGSLLDVKYDWSDSYLRKHNNKRPNRGETTKSISGVDMLLPIVMTKDWVAFGDPFTLAEEKSFIDDYEAHNPQDGEQPTTQQLPMVGDARGFDMRFTVDRDVYEAITLSESGFDLFNPRLDVEDQGRSFPRLMTWTDVGQTGKGQTAYKIVEKEGQEDVPQKDKLYTLTFGVIVEAWVEHKPEPDSTSNPFRLGINYEGNELTTEQFMCVFGGGETAAGAWNRDSKIVDIGLPDDGQFTPVTNAIYSPRLVSAIKSGAAPTITVVEPAKQPEWIRAFEVVPTGESELDLNIQYNLSSSMKTKFDCDLMFSWVEGGTDVSFHVNGLHFVPTTQPQGLISLASNQFALAQTGAVDDKGSYVAYEVASQAQIVESLGADDRGYTVELYDPTGQNRMSGVYGSAHNSGTINVASAIGEEATPTEALSIISFNFSGDTTFWNELWTSNIPFSMKLIWNDKSGTPHEQWFTDLQFIDGTAARSK